MAGLAGLEGVGSWRSYVGDPPAALHFGLHAGEGVVEGGDVGDDRLLVGPRRVDVLGVEQRRDRQLALGHVERVLRPSAPQVNGNQSRFRVLMVENGHRRSSTRFPFSKRQRERKWK